MGDLLSRLEASVYALADEVEQARTETAAARAEHAAVRAACDALLAGAVNSALP